MEEEKKKRMQFTEFKTSSLLLTAGAGAVVVGLNWVIDVPSEAYWAIVGLFVGNAMSNAKDLITSPAGDSEMFKVVKMLITKDVEK